MYETTNMNRTILNKIMGFLLALTCFIFFGCSQEELSNPNQPNDNSPKVLLTFSASSELTTRTQLSGGDNLQHVQHVHLFIFEGTGHNATCVASEAVDWTDLAAPQGKPTVQKKHHVKYRNFKAGIQYTFLAIGMDDHAGETFNLPNAVSNGTTLENAKAILTAGKTRKDIAISELFGGSTVLTPNATKQVIGTVDLYRRVAGVMGWFKNIPQTINGKNVKYLRIELYKGQNKSIWLCKPENNTADIIMEAIDDTQQSNKILIEIELQPEHFEKDKIISKGSYVLPMIAPFATEEKMTAAGYNDAKTFVKDYTLQVVLVAEDGTVLNTRKVRNKEAAHNGGTDGGTGIIITSNTYLFPIKVNWFYPIGSEKAPVEWPTTSNGKLKTITSVSFPMN